MPTWTPEQLSEYAARRPLRKSTRPSPEAVQTAVMPVLPMAPEMLAHVCVFSVPGVPVPKPRMTRRDQWAKRGCVVRYRDFCDRVRAAAKLQCLKGETAKLDGLDMEFHMPMPASWSKKRKRAFDGQPHRQVPDVDNLAKGVSDALLEDDSSIWIMRCTKHWCQAEKARAVVTLIFSDD